MFARKKKQAVQKLAHEIGSDMKEAYHKPAEWDVSPQQFIELYFDTLHHLPEKQARDLDWCMRCAFEARERNEHDDCDHRS